VKVMARQKVAGKITFVSSTLGYMSFVGYSSYAPAKTALRSTQLCLFFYLSISKDLTLPHFFSELGLADTLSSECALYDIGVHIYFPPTMYTPGYEEENKTKPSITKKIEETDGGLTTEQAATAMLRGTDTFPFVNSDHTQRTHADFPSRSGVSKSQAHISGDLITSLFRVSTRGATPNHNLVVDAVLGLIGWVRWLTIYHELHRTDGNFSD